jgi:hypothetical protein
MDNKGCHYSGVLPFRFSLHDRKHLLETSVDIVASNMRLYKSNRIPGILAYPIFMLPKMCEAAYAPHQDKTLESDSY